MTTCPMCKAATLQPTTYDDLPINECQSCGGAWLRANEYTVWLRTQTPGTYNLTGIEAHQSNDSKQAAFCPDCGHFMRSYRIGSEIGFRLDRCNNCHGVWFDKHEWQTLKAADLHDEVNRIFTKPWQKQIQEAETADKLDLMYQARFGEEDYQKIKGIREWLKSNPNRNTLLAFIIDEDPYRA
jgi:Zn-finger nucleic acid-binding protein